MSDKWQKVLTILLALGIFALLTAQTGSILRDLNNSPTTRKAMITALHRTACGLDSFGTNLQYDTLTVSGMTASGFVMALPVSYATADSFGAYLVNHLTDSTFVVRRKAADVEMAGKYLWFAPKY